MNLQEQILQLFEQDTEECFSDVAMKVFRYQAEHNELYSKYLSLVHCKVDEIIRYQDIPLLPISLFKSHMVKTAQWEAAATFKSSGTGTMGIRSQHAVYSLAWYEQVSDRIFRSAGYDSGNAVVLSLLPSYRENKDSSLVYMVDHFAKRSMVERSAYLYDHRALMDHIVRLLHDTDKQLILFGVSYALLDLAESDTLASDRLTVIFTGGMKNRGVELSFSALSGRIKTAFPLSKIVGEYGMTELLSHCYSDEFGFYKTPATLRILSKDIADPLSNTASRTGQAGLIDLSNYRTMSFILSDDLITRTGERQFQLRGRLQDSDIRGCNQLYRPIS